MGCEQRNKSNGNTYSGNTMLANKDTASYKMVNFKRISSYFQMNEDRMDTTFFEVDYPQFENEQMDSLINKTLLYDGEQNLEQAAESFLLGYDEFIEDNDNGIAKAAWFKKSKVTVHVNTPKIITFSNFTYEYTGGAHANYYTLYHNYDPVNNELIGLEAIIPDYKKQDLLRIAEKHFRKLENIDDTASYSNQYFFDNQQFQLADNFALLKDSLLFYYNVYEIKAYSEGPTPLKIPYEAIKDLFNAKGLHYIQSINH